MKTFLLHMRNISFIFIIIIIIIIIIIMQWVQKLKKEVLLFFVWLN